MMPWKSESPMDQRHRFVSLAESGHFTVIELCEQFGISRKTAYKWIGRFRECGSKGLEDRSRAPKQIPGRTDTEVERLIVAERRRRPTWGPKKLRVVMMTKHGIDSPPSTSTIGAILTRNGLVESRRRKPGVFRVDRSTLTGAERCNQVWATDFKGWFHLGDMSRCDPLTVSDLHSRYLIGIKALPQATRHWTMRAFKRVFEDYGMPEIIRVDNGAPFASMGPGGLSKLSVWWISLGIDVEFTRPGSPQDNGSHERMHRTMKAECCRPASVNGAAQQQRFDRWRKDFNKERPHESLDQRRPAEVYQASHRRYDEAIKTHLYKPSQETKRVGSAGFISINGKSCFVGEAFEGADVAIEREADTGLSKVYYANVHLGDLDDSSSARLRPPAFAKRWRNRSCPETEA
jgi:transposase InsO family protein